MKGFAKKTLATFLAVSPLLAVACGGSGLASVFHGTQCNVGPVVNGQPTSWKEENNPTTEYYCTSLPGSNRDCIHASVAHQQKVTEYNGANCSGDVNRVLDWSYAEAYEEDTLCTCPPIWA